MLLLCNVHISSHPLNKQQEQIQKHFWTEKTLILSFEWRGPGAHCVAMEMSRGNIMKLCGECNNCTKFQFYTEKVFRDLPFFVILHHFVSTM